MPRSALPLACTAKARKNNGSLGHGLRKRRGEMTQGQAPPAAMHGSRCSRVRMERMGVGCWKRGTMA